MFKVTFVYAPTNKGRDCEVAIMPEKGQMVLWETEDERKSYVHSIGWEIRSNGVFCVVYCMPSPSYD